jgi:hypothetical protein
MCGSTPSLVISTLSAHKHRKTRKRTAVYAVRYLAEVCITNRFAMP